MTKFAPSKFRCFLVLGGVILVCFCLQLRMLRHASSTETSARYTWEKKTFCHDFIVNTFHEEIPLCGGTEAVSMDQVKCYGSVYTNHMVMCSYENLAMNPKQMMNVIPDDVNWNNPRNRTINFLQSSSDIACKSSSVNYLTEKTDRNDFQLKLTQHLLESEKLSPSICDAWINKTTFFHISSAFHIYFRFLNLYNVHKALLDYKVTDKNHLVLRIGNMNEHYMFPDFDKSLFTGALTLKDLGNKGVVCFKKVVLVPRSYQSVLFRCKMDGLLQRRCFECSGRGLSASPLYTFRRRVLRACNITDKGNKTSRLIVISRKPYKRWPDDDPSKFGRVLLNEDQMVAKIRNIFPQAITEVIHMEDLGICEQVRYAVEADVMLGVHGAGLVHFWWLRDEATALELEPSLQTSNPSFRMLTTLAGKNYVSELIGGTAQGVSVNIDFLLQSIKHYL